MKAWQLDIEQPHISRMGKVVIHAPSADEALAEFESGFYDEKVEWSEKDRWGRDVHITELPAVPAAEDY